ncbi:beta-phosphoglucomutase family hydrolase [soil metagenome]
MSARHPGPDPAAVDWSRIDAVLFDLDGVLTPTAEIHERAWKQTFDDFLTDPNAPSGDDTSEFTGDDYLRYVDGKPRYDGVRSFLESRGIELPRGSPYDEPGHDTIAAVGNAKNDAFQKVLRRDGIDGYPGSVALLDVLQDREVKMAVVSSSRNAGEVLKVSGLARRFDVVVDGGVAKAEGLAGKPAPDTFELAARRVGVPPERAAVAEDALSGVAAGRAGSFGLVIGVNRGAGHDALLEHGADVVVNDLDELIEAARHAGGSVS